MIAPHNKRMHSAQNGRYARILTAYARRYVKYNYLRNTHEQEKY